MKILLLNSAHGKHTKGCDSWVRATIRSIHELSAIAGAFVCSTEPVSWDLGAFLAGKSGADINLVVKSDDTDEGRRHCDTVIADMDIDKRRVYPVFLDISETPRRKEKWRLRDMVALREADVVYPISLRPGGRLDSLLRDNPFDTEIRDDFRISWESVCQVPRYNFSNMKTLSLPSGDWLIHWTRSSPGPWPGERSGDYFRDMLARPGIFVRDAKETLIHILNEGVIRGSSWRVPGKTSSVAFSSLRPEDAVDLMRWRKRYVRYSFEPYGIGIRKGILEERGARSVKYANTRNICDDGDRLFVQSAGERADWAREREWRLKGDCSLGTIDEKDYIILVPDDNAARDVASRTDSSVVVAALFES